MPGSIETGRWYDIRIELSGANIKAFLDGALIHDTTVKPAVSLYAVAGRDQQAGELVLDVVNTASAPCETEIAFEGSRKLTGPGKELVLTSANPSDENTLGLAPLVAPREKPIDVAGSHFHYTFPANALTVLRLKED